MNKKINNVLLLVATCSLSLLSAAFAMDEEPPLTPKSMTQRIKTIEERLRVLEFLRKLKI
jgi:hypothetical protein